MTTPEPFEAKQLPAIPITDANRKIFTNIVVAVQGAPFHSDMVNGIAYALRYLRANPIEARIILGMLPGGENALDRRGSTP